MILFLVTSMLVEFTGWHIILLGDLNGYRLPTYEVVRAL